MRPTPSTNCPAPVQRQWLNQLVLFTYTLVAVLNWSVVTHTSIRNSSIFLYYSKLARYCHFIIFYLLHSPSLVQLVKGFLGYDSSIANYNVTVENITRKFTPFKQGRQVTDFQTNFLANTVNETSCS